MAKEKTPTKPIFIIKAKDNTIDVLNLSSDKRKKTLNSEAISTGILLVDIYNNLLDNINHEDEIQRVLSSNNNETIQFLIENNWIIPIIDDYYLVGETKDCPDIKIQSRKEFQKRIENQYQTNILANALKPYENRNTEDNIVFTSSINRMGIRSSVLDKGNFDIERSIIQGEIISVKSLLLDLKYIFSSKFLMEQNIFNNVKLFKPEIKYKSMNNLIKSNDNYIKKTIQIYEIIETIKYFYKNNKSYDYELNQIKLNENSPLIQAYLSNTLIKERDLLFRDFLPKQLEKIYGKYNKFDTLSDISIGRQAFVNNKYRGLPYYYYLISDTEQLDKLIRNSEYRDFIKQLQGFLKEIQIKEKMKLRLYRMAIQLQLSKKKLDEVNKKMVKNNADITTLLSKKELEIVNKYIGQLKENQKKVEKSKCPHFEIRKKYDNTIVEKERNFAFSKLLKDFIGKAEDETKLLYCTNCGFNCGCEHEIIEYKLLTSNDEYQKAQLEEKLDNEYYIRDNTIYKCKYCGRKTKDAENDEQIEFDDEGYLVKGNKIDNISPEYLKLQDLAKETVIHLGIQRYENPFQLAENVFPFLDNKYEKIKKMELKTNEVEVMKKLYMYIELYAIILSKLIKKKYKIWNQNPNIFEKSDNIDLEGKFILEIFRVIKEKNKLFYNFLIANSVKSKFISGLKKSYKTILADDNVIDKSRFRSYVKKYRNKIDNIFELAKDKNPYVNNYSNKNQNEVIKYLNNNTKYRLYQIENENPINISENKQLNGLLQNLVLEGVPHFTNITIYPSRPLEPLNPIGKYFMYNERKYNKDGSEIKWDTLLLIKGKKEIEVNKKKLKSRLKKMKDDYNLNYSINEEELDGITPITVNEYKKDEISGKLVKSKLSKKGTKQLYEKIIEYNDLESAKGILKDWCGNESSIEYDGQVFNCNASKSELNNVIRILEKRKIKGKLEKRDEIYFPEAPKGNDNLDKSKMEKIKKELGINPEIITRFGETPFEVLEYEEKIKKEFKGIELEIKMKKLNRSKNTNRINIIINSIIKLQQEYQILHTGSLTNCYKSPSFNYLCDFINEKKENDFKNILPRDEYSIAKYNDIKYTEQLNYKQKTNILLNIFMDLILFVSKTPLSKKYLNSFIFYINKTQLLLDVSADLFNKIEQSLDLQQRKNFEKYLKMTPEEKLVKSFGDANLEEQIAILNEEVEKEDEKIEYNEEYNQTLNDMSLDEEINIDDDYQFMDESLWGEDEFEDED